jgi:hypothetical protein
MNKVGYVTLSEETESAQEILLGKPLTMRPLGRRRILEIVIKMVLKGMGIQKL